MRVVEYNGVPVKHQKKVKDKIKVVFYDGRKVLVTEGEWRSNSANRYYANGERRSHVCRRANPVLS